MKKATAIREESTAHWDPQTWQAIQWLRSNKDKFKGQVYEPARITIFPKYECRGRKLDPRNEVYLKLIEAPISRDAFRVSLSPFLLLSLSKKERRIDRLRVFDYL